MEVGKPPTCRRVSTYIFKGARRQLYREGRKHPTPCHRQLGCECDGKADKFQGASCKLQEVEQKWNKVGSAQYDLRLSMPQDLLSASRR